MTHSQNNTNGAPPTADAGSDASHYATVSGTTGAALAGELQKMRLKPVGAGASAAAAVDDKAVAASAPSTGRPSPAREKVSHLHTKPVSGEISLKLAAQLPLQHPAPLGRTLAVEA